MNAILVLTSFVTRKVKVTDYRFPLSLVDYKCCTVEGMPLVIDQT